MTQPVQILCVGEIIWDCFLDGSNTPERLGGAPFNLAYRLHTLGNTVHILSRVGNDARGIKSLKSIEAFGMSTSLVQIDQEHPTGQANYNGRWEIAQNVAYDYIAESDVITPILPHLGALCFGSLAQRSPQVKRTLQGIFSRLPPTCLSVFDVNLRPQCYDDDTLLSSLRLSDVVKVNYEPDAETELQYLQQMCLGARQLQTVPEICSALMAHPEFARVKVFVVTMGASGAYACRRCGTALESAMVPGVSVQVADTVGSGDAFTAGFLDSYIRGESLLECLLKGNTMGALVATQIGATEPILPEQITALLDTQRRALSAIQ